VGEEKKGGKGERDLGPAQEGKEREIKYNSNVLLNLNSKFKSK
jgi:hypothetical protein